MSRPEIRLSDLTARYDLDPERSGLLARMLAQSTKVRRGGRLAWEASGRLLVRAEPHGSFTAYDPSGPACDPPRPLFQVDRHVHLTWAIARDSQGRLVRAKLRAFEGRWVGVARGWAVHPLWGASDVVLALAGPAGFVEQEVLTVFQTVDYERLRFIPPLDRPAALPPGAGGALLNLLALLGWTQRARGIRYRGPYATAQLFDALTASFRPWSGAGDPRRRFTEAEERRALEGRLDEVPPTWRPAPHERSVVGHGVEVVMRRGLEAVRWRGRTYRASSRWHPARALQVMPSPEGWRAGLVLLGEMVEEHVRLDPWGEVVSLDGSSGPTFAVGPPLGSLWRETIESALVVQCPSLLVAALRRVLPEIEFRWGEVPGDLMRVQDAQVLASTALVDHLQRSLAQVPGREARLALAARAVGELLEAVGPPVRRMAQAWLEALPLEGQLACLTEGAADAVTDAKAGLASAFPALCRQLAQGSGAP